MRHLQNLAATLVARWLEVISRDQTDRGDSPVPTAIIVAILAAGAVAIGAAILDVANDWVARLPTSGTK